MILEPETDRWADSIPELQTRPACIGVMHQNPRLRRSFVRIHDDLFSLARAMVDHRLASEMLEALWSKRIGNFSAAWRGRVEDAIYGELHGALRNIFHNSMARATGRAQPLRGNDIERPLRPRISPP